MRWRTRLRGRPRRPDRADRLIDGGVIGVPSEKDNSKIPSRSAAATAGSGRLDFCFMKLDMTQSEVPRR